MRKFYWSVLVCMMSLMTSFTTVVNAQQIPNSDFEDWSGEAFAGNPQPKYWNASNVTQVGMNFNFGHKEAGRNGGYSFMVQDQEVGAMGITEVSPGYFSLGHAWVFINGLNVSSACAGTYGGYAFTYRPDTMSVWIRRTGNNTDKEDFYLLYYAWLGETRADKYPNKGGGCTEVTHYDEESDVRQALDPNGCGTTVKGTQVAEGMWREKQYYGDWTNIKVPIYYFNDQKPEKVNLLFSASNYPNGSSSENLYAGNSLYVDDIELIYSAKIQKLIINGIEWKGFDPNSTAVQNYALGESATEIPTIVAKRGAGSITNAGGTTAAFPGRTLTGSEIKIEKGDLESKPTKITVKSDDGKKTMVYQIQFQKAASSNAKLAGISYTVNGVTKAIADFSPTKYNYTVDLVYGTTAVPTLSADKQEDAQTLKIDQPTSVTGAGKIVVTAPNKQTTATYSITFRVAELADNTLKDIKVNGKSIPGFNPSQAVYKVSLPVGTDKLTVEPVSAYAAGAQTIKITPNPLPTGDAINGATVQIAVTTPGNTVAKTYKLNIKLEASSYSYLSNLVVEGYDIKFVPEQTTYSVCLPMGTTELPKIYYEPGDEYQTVEISKLADGVVDGTVRVTVTAGNGTDQTVYKLVFKTEKSSNSYLAGIKIGGEDLPGFDPEVTNYTVQLAPGTTELPEIEPIKGDPYQDVSVTTGGVNGKTRITVMAGNGSTTIYQITFSVETFSNNKLATLAVEGYDIAFDPETDEYWVNLPQGTTTHPAVTYTLVDTKLQTAAVRDFSGATGDYRITVRPQSGASRTYIIHFTVATSSNVTLANLKVEGYCLRNMQGDSVAFDPAVTEYTVKLDEGVSKIPAVTFVKAEESQRVLSVLENRIQTITVTAESGAKQDYTITFIIQVSQNAFLDMIYLNGDSLQGFRKDSMSYEVKLAGDTCPVITVDKAVGQQITITAPYGVGEAQIRVQPGEGAANTYTILFTTEAAESVRLKDIRINGVSISGFNPTKTSYEATYAGLLPTVEGVAAAEGQTVSPTSWKGETAWIYVVDQDGNKEAYSVKFTRTTQTISTLQAIYADGVLLEGFHADTLHYAYELPAGSTYPEISYKASDATQVVFFGQTAEGRWAIHVAAENGAKTIYSVTYTIAKYADASLLGLTVEGHALAFDPATKVYNINLDEGETLPVLTPILRTAQSVVTYDVNANEQRVVVTAENGDSTAYTIHYNRTLSANALLRDILIDGQSLPGFRSDSSAYSVTLPIGTKVVPNVFAVAQLNNQTITTEYSRPNGTTRIHVVAQDGTTAKNYTIDFPVALSTNTKLGSLSINGELQDVNETDYFFNLPYGSTLPYEVLFTRASSEQLIDYQLGGLNDVTRITVKAENGDSRTYTIRYKVAEPEGINVIDSITYEYVTSKDVTKTKSISLQGDTVIDLPYGAKSFSVIHVKPHYPEQSVVFYNGGIRRGATIIVSANREGESDKTYKITPRMPEYDQAGKLRSIKFRGEEIENFRPDVYNYIVKVTNSSPVTLTNFSANVFTGTGTTYTKGALDEKKKQILFTTKVNGVDAHVYSICWYYENDTDPFDLSDPWVLAEYKTGMKPSNGWKVIADYSQGYNLKLLEYNIPYTTGKEVSPYGDNGVLLATMRQGALMTTVPGIMTLGEMYDVNFTSLGNSVTKVRENATVGKQFRNTPEQLKIEYKALRSSGIDKWRVWVTMSDGTNYEKVDSSYNYSDSSTGVKYIPLSYPSEPVQIINATLNSCAYENAKDMAGYSDNNSADLVLQNMHLVYNSELTAATVDGKAADKNGRTLSATVADDYIGIPSLTFSGAVHDQTQVIEWLNDGEWLNGELQARVINYGENLEDSTHYFVVIKRKAETSLEYSIDFGTYPTKPVGDTVFVTLPYGTKALPDIEITPGSIHQRFAIEKNEMNIKVTVSAESGAENTTVYAFREERTSDVTLDSFEALDAKEADIKNLVSEDDSITIYTATDSRIPTIAYTKKDDVVGQTFAVTYTPDSAMLVVTAADGQTRHTYLVRRLDPVIVTTAQLKDFRIGDEDIADFGMDKTNIVKERPADCVFFTRVSETDSVVFVQSETAMQWLVYGSKEMTYTLTYPTVPSTNKQLKVARLNGAHYEDVDFNPDLYDYTIVKDSAMTLALEPAEASQQLRTTFTQSHDTIVYKAVVTAENNDSAIYTFTVHEPKSNIASLAGILVDSVLVPDFHPDTLDYTAIIPSPKAKQVEPQMPSVTYEAGQKGQTINLTPVWEMGETIDIEVQSQQGTSRMYHLTVKAEPSSCTDLSGIMVNGVLVDDFEPGNHRYSVMIKKTEVEIDYTSEDRFQTVAIHADTIDANHYQYALTVTAQDGVNVSKPYIVDVYIEKKSSDATLAGILLDGKEMIDFEPEINGKLAFDPGNNTYNINMPSGLHTLPEVSARLKMDGQSVSIDQTDEKVDLNVTAVDGSLNTYHLNFNWPKSTNANLAMIYLDGDSLPGFDPNYNFYKIDLPIGVHKMPEVAAQKGEAEQTLKPIEIDTDKWQAMIKVQAEDTTTRENTYVIDFLITLSDADTLDMIYQDGDSLPGFRADSMYYVIALPVGTDAFPDLSWLEADELQSVKLDTVESSDDKMIRQILVTSESGKKNTYTVSYTILKSDVDTLQYILVDGQRLPDFDARTHEYFYTLSIDKASELGDAIPSVAYAEGDSYQTVNVTDTLETLSGKYLKRKAVITVTSQSGKERSYTIHFRIELSDVAAPDMIFLNGDSMPNFDPERFNYTRELTLDAAMPVVSVRKAEDAQTYDIRVGNDTITVIVWAENRDSLIYSLFFERLMSDNTTLRDIILTDQDGTQLSSAIFPFRPDVYEYTINLDANGTADELLLPDIQIVFSDSLQTADTVHHTLPNGDIRIVITVTAPNEEDQAEYSLTFHFVKPAIALLTDIILGEQSIEDFDPLITEYTYRHPYGTDPEDLFTADDVSYVLADSLASATVTTDDSGAIIITVIAQDETTENSYFIRQEIGKDSNNDLQWITIGGDELPDFDPDVTFYTYLLSEGAAVPIVDAAPASENAEILDISTVAAGDTCVIICQAADESMKRYYIHFAISPINEGKTAVSSDVLVKRIPGTYQIVIATLRKDVSFAMYDQSGHVVYMKEVPVANPNEVDVRQDANGQDVLNDVDSSAGLVINVIPRQVYFYSFFVSGGTKSVNRGKFICY